MGHFSQLAIWVFQLSTAGLSVSGSSTCPHPRDVATQLDAVLPSRATGAFQAFIENTSTGTVTVELQDEHGGVVGAGSLPGNEPCDALANAAAVMIAAWHARLAAPASVPTLPAQRPAPPPAPPATRLRFELAAAPALVLGGGAATLGGRLSGTLGPQGSRWKGELAITAQAWRDISMGTGSAQWLRTAVQLGPAWAVLEGPFRVQLGFFGIGSLLSVQGLGFDSNLASSGFELGAGASATAAYPLRNLSPFLTVGTSYWPGVQKLTIGGIEQSATVPQLEVFIALGAAWGWE